jgi:hypothetical protein
MAKSTFTSFHFDRDYWRVQQVRNMGAIEGNQIISPQSWEEVKRKGKAAIENWIDGEMKGKSAVVVLVGKETASREWVNYEIRKAWDEKRPLVGIRINGLKNKDGYTDTQGTNPFANITAGGVAISKYVPLHTPSGTDSKAVYQSINDNLATWVAGAYKRP